MGSASQCGAGNTRRHCVAILRAAFDKTVRDPELLAEGTETSHGRHSCARRAVANDGEGSHDPTPEVIEQIKNCSFNKDSPKRSGPVALCGRLDQMADRVTDLDVPRSSIRSAFGCAHAGFEIADFSIHFEWLLSGIRRKKKTRALSLLSRLAKRKIVSELVSLLEKCGGS